MNEQTKSTPIEKQPQNETNKMEIIPPENEETTNNANSMEIEPNEKENKETKCNHFKEFDEWLKIKETLDIDVFLKELYQLFPKIEIFFKCAKEHQIQIDTFENIFKFISSAMFKFFIEENIAYDDKYLFMKEILMKYHQYFNKMKEY